MLMIDRQREIIEQMLREGSVKVPELSKKYNVRDETIRRDLKTLAKSWDIEIVYGGAYIKNSLRTQVVKELALNDKRKENYEAKQIIAKKAAELIEEGDTIGFNNGSTVEYILDYLNDIELNIVTMNVHIASKALLLPKACVYLPGGKVRHNSGMIMGPNSIDFIKSFVIDKCFFGVSAFSIQRGIMHPVIEEVESNTAMLSVSREIYIVTDSSKFSKTSLFNMAFLEQIQNIIVDDDFPPEYREYMVLKNIQII
jgi:DeoR/GlpR family transcriptional regulator of sugar metabolism